MGCPRGPQACWQALLLCTFGAEQQKHWFCLLNHSSCASRPHHYGCSCHTVIVGLLGACFVYAEGKV